MELLRIGQNTTWGIIFGFTDSLFGITSVRHLYLNKLNLKENDVLKKDEKSKNNFSLSNASNSKFTYNQQTKKQNVARSNIFYCCILNGFIFLCSKIIFEYVLLPFFFISFQLISGKKTTNNELWLWIPWLLSCTFSTFWLLPIFLLSRVVNIFFFQEIADSSFRGRTQQLKSISNLVADYFFSLFVQAMFIAQTMSVKFIPLPYVNTIMEVIHLSLLYSMYSFEYKWFNMGWELHKRLHFIEFNWPYFVGFGLPLAILTSFMDDFILRGGIFSLLFPFFIISSNVVKPKRGFCDISIPIFQPSVWISNTILKIILFLWQKSFLLRTFPFMTRQNNQSN